MNLKVLITLFQKMLWFIGAWANVYEILAIKISKRLYRNLETFLQLQTLMSPK